MEVDAEIQFSSSRNAVEESKEGLYEKRNQYHDGETHRDRLPELVGVH